MDQSYYVMEWSSQSRSVVISAKKRVLEVEERTLFVCDIIAWGHCFTLHSTQILVCPDRGRGGRAEDVSDYPSRHIGIAGPLLLIYFAIQEIEKSAPIPVITRDGLV